MFASEWRMGSGAKDALLLRRAVFLGELGWPEEAVFDGADAYAAHLIIEADGVPVASARLCPKQDGISLSHICVLPAYRGQGFGDLCTRQALYKAQSLLAPRVFADAPERYAAYYAAFGFREQGAPKAGIVKMTLNTDNIVWHPPCSLEALPPNLR